MSSDERGITLYETNPGTAKRFATQAAVFKFWVLEAIYVYVRGKP